MRKKDRSLPTQFRNMKNQRIKTRNCLSKEIIRTLTESTRFKQKVEEINDNVKSGTERLKFHEESKGDKIKANKERSMKWTSQLD
jgi:hypothetical protein